MKRGMTYAVLKHFGKIPSLSDFFDIGNWSD